MNFRCIQNYPDYIIYENGDVYSIKNQCKLVPLNNGNGYWKVNLFKDKKSKQFYIHRLVAEAFIDNNDNCVYVDHIDRDKNNNTLLNLRWSTAKSNSNNLANKPRYSKSKKGQDRVDPTIISSIIKDFKNGDTVMRLSRKYKVPRQSVSRYIKPFNIKLEIL